MKILYKKIINVIYKYIYYKCNGLSYCIYPSKVIIWQLSTPSYTQISDHLKMHPLTTILVTNHNGCRNPQKPRQWEFKPFIGLNVSNDCCSFVRTCLPVKEHYHSVVHVAFLLQVTRAGHKYISPVPGDRGAQPRSYNSNINYVSDMGCAYL